MNKPKIISFILAGGSGTRLAPLSLTLPGKLPKQFLPLLSNKTMLQETLERLPDEVERVIICESKYKDEVKKQVGNKARILAEPFPCNTAMAIGLGAIYAKKLFGDENTVVFFNPSDHHMNTDYFRKYYATMIDAATESKIITMGITPDRPETGLGYIKVKSQITNNKSQTNLNDPNSKEGIFEVERFVEKPNLENAKKFVKSGEYFWNSGMFCFTVKTILDKLKIHAPIIYDSLLKIEKSLGTEKEKEIIEKEYKSVKEQKANISIDFAVMEKEAKNILLVKAEKELEWDDIGLWIALKKYFPTDESGNVKKGLVEFKMCFDVLALNYSSNQNITVDGLNDFLIVNTLNGLLVCPQSSSIRASEIVLPLNNGQKEILIDCENVKTINKTGIPVSYINCKNLKVNYKEEEISIYLLSG